MMHRTLYALSITLLLTHCRAEPEPSTTTTTTTTTTSVGGENPSMDASVAADDASPVEAAVVVPDVATIEDVADPRLALGEQVHSRCTATRCHGATAAEPRPLLGRERSVAELHAWVRRRPHEVLTPPYDDEHLAALSLFLSAHR